MFWVLQVATLHVSRFPCFWEDIAIKLDMIYLRSTYVECSTTYQFCHGMGIEMNCYGIRVRVTMHFKIYQIRKYLVIWTRMPRLKLLHYFIILIGIHPKHPWNFCSQLSLLCLEISHIKALPFPHIVDSCYYASWEIMSHLIFMMNFFFNDKYQWCFMMSLVTYIRSTFLGFY
jgi:hypothetical protein